MKICVFGTFDVRRHPRVAILEDGLLAHGFEVVRCNVPWSTGTADRVRAVRSPLTALRALRELIGSWRALREKARYLEGVDAVIVGYLGVLDVHLVRRCFPGALIVLDHLAPIVGILEDRRFGRVLQRLGRLLDRAAERRADLLLADTCEHAAGMERGSSVIVPVGAPTSWFSPAVRPESAAPLRIVFFGLFTPLQGAPVIAEAIATALDAGADLEVSMIGRGQDLAACQEALGDRPEVHWQSWVEPTELPDVVASHHVCLGVFGVTPKAGRVVPNKVFQGAAAGCAIVTSDTAPQRRLLGNAGAFVPPGDAAALASILGQLADDPVRVARLREAARELGETSFQPVKVVEPLVEQLRANIRRA